MINLMLASNKWIADYVKQRAHSHRLNEIVVCNFEMFSIPHNRFLNQLTFCNKKIETQIIFTFSCEIWSMLDYKLWFREVSAMPETKYCQLFLNFDVCSQISHFLIIKSKALPQSSKCHKIFDLQKKTSHNKFQY